MSKQKGTGAVSTGGDNTLYMDSVEKSYDVWVMHRSGSILESWSVQFVCERYKSQACIDTFFFDEEFHSGLNSSLVVEYSQTR